MLEGGRSFMQNGRYDNSNLKSFILISSLRSRHPVKFLYIVGLWIIVYYIPADTKAVTLFILSYMFFVTVFWMAISARPYSI